MKLMMLLMLFMMNQTKMNIIKTICLSFALIIAFTNVNAQSENKDVTITASGSGKTLEDAKQLPLMVSTLEALNAL